MTGCTCMSPAWLCFQAGIMNPPLHNCSDAAAPGAEFLLLIKARILQNSLGEGDTGASQVGLASKCKDPSVPGGGARARAI